MVVQLTAKHIMHIMPSGKWYGVLYNEEDNCYYAEHIVAWAVVSTEQIENGSSTDNVIGLFIPQNAEDGDIAPEMPSNFYQYVHEDDMESVLSELNATLAERDADELDE